MNVVALNAVLQVLLPAGAFAVGAIAGAVLVGAVAISVRAFECCCCERWKLLPPVATDGHDI